jgi:protein gp37
MGLSIALPFPPQYDQPFSKVQLLPGRLDIPLHWRKPRMVFVCSMSDLFHEEVPDEFIERVLATAWVARLHTYLFLTKRAERMRAFFSESSKRIYNIGILGEEIAGRAMPSMIWPLPNVWLGVSVENQATVDERIPLLLDTPAAVRFVSAEPLLGPVDLEPYMIDLRDVTDDLLDAPDGAEVDGMERVGSQWCRNSGIDWLIVGGESGPHWRPMELAWVESLRAQCEAARVPMFGKQAAGPRPDIALPGRLGERSWPL